MTSKSFLAFCHTWLISVGGAIGLVSLLGLFAWFSGFQGTNFITSQFAPFNLAGSVALLLSGSCLILLHSKQNKVVGLISAVIILLALLSLGARMMELNSGLGAGLGGDSVIDRFSPLEPMSITPALGFACIGLGFVLYTQAHRHHYFLSYVSILGGLVLAIGLVALVNFGLNIFSQTDWQQNTAMALSGSICFCFLGVSLIILALQQQTRESINFSTFSLPLATVLLMFCLTISIVIENNHSKQSQLILRQQLNNQIEQVDQQLNFMHNSLSLIATPWESEKALLVKPDRQTAARLLINTLPFINALSLLDADNTSRWIIGDAQQKNTLTFEAIAQQLKATEWQKNTAILLSSNTDKTHLIFAVPIKINPQSTELLLASVDLSALVKQITSVQTQTTTWLSIRSGPKNIYSSATTNTRVTDQYSLTQQREYNGLTLEFSAGYLIDAPIYQLGIQSSAVAIMGSLLAIVLLINFYAYQKSNAFMHEIINEKERFRLVIEAAPGAMILTSAEGVIELFNNKANTLFGYQNEELLTKNVDLLVPLDYQAGHSKLRDSYQQKPGFRSMAKGRSLHGLHKNGQLIPVEIELCPIHTEQGLKILASIFDLSERTKQLLELKRSKDELDRAGRTAKIGAWHVDLKTGLMHWSAQTYKIFEVPPDTPLSKDFNEQFYSSEDAKKRKQAIKNSLDTGEEWKFEFLISTFKGNKIWIRSHGQVELENAEPVRVMGVIQDITEERLRMIELERRNQELNNFAYVASHDLKSPLRGIDQIATWLNEDLSATLDVKTKELLRLMRSRINRMEKLLDDLLSYARTSRIDATIECVNVAKLVEQVFNFCNPENSFTLHIKGDEGEYLLSRTPMELVLRNLINNAIKHHDKQRGNITVAITQLNGSLQFSIADDGPGIPLEHRDRAFAMFQTLQPRDKVEGSGMGLAIVKKVIESFDGTIELTENHPRGAVFSFKWPAKAK